MKQEPQNPLILRCHRLMEAFAKSDEERDFYIDRQEGFLIYIDLDKSQAELAALESELKDHPDRYCAIPKLSFYEIKKIMEGFVNEKVYDIDTKEKLLDIIQSKEARENFLEFIYDHHAEQEKWLQFYQERSRIRIIEWLRQNHFHFVFEEDLDLPRPIIEKLKQLLFEAKASKEILNARKLLVAKAKTYYSSEALNPRPKRGRPPKQAIKQEIEPQVSLDVFITVPPVARPFLFAPEFSSSSAFSIFSSKFDKEDDLLQSRRQLLNTAPDASLNQKLASLRALSSRWIEEKANDTPQAPKESFDDDEEDDDDDFDEFVEAPKTKKTPSSKSKEIQKKESKTIAKPAARKAAPASEKKVAKPKAKRIMPRQGENSPGRLKPLKKILP